MTNQELELNLNRHERKIAFLRATRAADTAANTAARLAADANTAADYNGVIDALLFAAAAARVASDAAAAYPPTEFDNNE
jgi:hypothetical protein